MDVIKKNTGQWGLAESKSVRAQANQSSLSGFGADQHQRCDDNRRGQAPGTRGSDHKRFEEREVDGEERSEECYEEDRDLGEVGQSLRTPTVDQPGAEDGDIGKHTEQTNRYDPEQECVFALLNGVAVTDGAAHGLAAG